jgi:hypothetical protein
MILPGTRLLLVAFSGLTLLAFVVLFGLADQTELRFAWTIQPPVTAAFLGAAYAAGCVLVLLALRKGTWSALRIPYLTIPVFAVLTLVATLMHYERFHFAAPTLLARFAAYFWLGVYIVVPLAMAAALVGQQRRPHDHPPRRALPWGLAVLLLVQGVLMLAAGAALFVVPMTEAVLWPWQLTPLTARVVAAWLVAFGLGALLAWGQRDLARVEVAAWAYGLLAVLQLLVVALYAGTVRWTAPATWVYLALMASILAGSAYALRHRHSS